MEIEVVLYYDENIENNIKQIKKKRTFNKNTTSAQKSKKCFKHTYERTTVIRKLGMP